MCINNFFRNGRSTFIEIFPDILFYHMTINKYFRSSLFSILEVQVIQSLSDISDLFILVLYTIQKKVLVGVVVALWVLMGMALQDPFIM